MMAKNKNIIDLEIDRIGDQNHRLTESDSKELSKYFSLDKKGREEYLEEIKRKNKETVQV